MNECISETNSSIQRVNIELDLSTYAAKVDLKNVIGVDTSKFAKKRSFDKLKI